jgi:hypothetical protein
MGDDAPELSAEDICNVAARWYGLALPTDRATAIAVELNGLNVALRRAARRLCYDDEPGAFAGALRDGRSEPGRD